MITREDTDKAWGDSLERREHKMPKPFLVRECAVCGHTMIIVLGKDGAIPDAVAYFGKVQGNYGELVEYWECAVCLESGDVK